MNAWPKIALLAVLFTVGVAASASAGKRPCPGNSCHGQTTTGSTTTATVPSTTTAPTTTSVPTTTSGSPGYTPPASIAADCSTDVAAQLNAWIQSVPDGATVQFGSGCYRVEAVLEIDHRRGLTFVGGTFKSFTAPADQRPFFRLVDTTASFQGTTLIGSYSSGGTLTDSLQHAHGFDLRGSAVTVSHAAISNVAGDCVYYGLGYDNTTRSTGSFTDSTCDGTGRNGVSVTAGDNVTVTGDRFSRVGYDGVDVEPNQAAGNWGASSVTVSGNSFATVALNALSVVETGPEALIVLNGNTSTSAMKVAVAAVSATYSRPQNVTIRDNTGATGSVSVEHVDGLIVSGNTGPVSISDCTSVTTAAAAAEPYDPASPWNTPIAAGQAADSFSATYIAAIADNGLPLTSDPDQYTPAVYTFDSSTPTRPVTGTGYFSSYDAGDSSRVGHGSPWAVQVPVAAGVVPPPGSDGQVILYDPAAGVEYGFWQFTGPDASGVYHATNGYRYHTGAGYMGRFADGLAGRGDGTPYLAGLVRPWEITQGHIDHALAFAYDAPSPLFVYPASKSDGSGTAGVDLPEGARLQLDPTLTDAQLAGYGVTGPGLVVAHALQRYGMFVVDHSGSSKVYLEWRGTAGWDSSVGRSMLSLLPWRAFRVVDVSGP